MQPLLQAFQFSSHYAILLSLEHLKIPLNSLITYHRGKITSSELHNTLLHLNILLHIVYTPQTRGIF